MKTKNCSQCNKVFDCGNPDRCWCSQFPALMPLQTDQDCLCRDCLPIVVNKRIHKFIESHSLEDVLKNAKKFETPDLLKNIDYNIEQGLLVFTKWYHLKRGFCCYKGCVNCPYKSEN